MRTANRGRIWRPPRKTKSRGRRSKRSNSGSSSSSESDIDTRRSTTWRKRKHRKKPDNEDEVLTNLVQGVAVLSKLQVATAERKRRKASVIGRLAPRQAFLFTALAAQDWEEF